MLVFKDRRVILIRGFAPDLRQPFARQDQCGADQEPGHKPVQLTREHGLAGQSREKFIEFLEPGHGVVWHQASKFHGSSVATRFTGWLAMQASTVRR